METRLMIAIITTVGLAISLGALTTLYSQNTFAQSSNTGTLGAGGRSTGNTMGTGSTGQMGGGGGSGGVMIGGSIGQMGGGGGSTGNTIGTGSTGQTGDHHLFCNTGMITPICK